MNYLLASALGVIFLNVVVVVFALIAAELRERRDRRMRQHYDRWFSIRDHRHDG